VSIKSKQSFKAQTSLMKNKSIKKKDTAKVQNNSIFSVSDVSKSEINEQNKEPKSEYLEYFEDLNKEIIERQNT